MTVSVLISFAGCNNFQFVVFRVHNLDTMIVFTYLCVSWCCDENILVVNIKIEVSN